MPLQLERGGEFVNAFIEYFHHAIVAAIDGDFAGPCRASIFSLHTSIGRDNPRAAHPPKAFPHPLENTRAIVAPLFLLIVTDEINHGIPVSVVNGVKEIFRMPPDLAFRLPKPHKVQSDASGKRQATEGSATNRDRHSHRLFPPEAGPVSRAGSAM